MSNPAGIPVTDGLVLAIVPARRSLLDFSGAGRHPTIAGAGLGWVRQGGVYQLRGQGTGRLVVAHDATLDALTDFTLCCSGTFGGIAAQRRVLSKEDAGGVQVDVYLDAGTEVEINDGANIRVASVGSWAGVRSFAIAQQSGAIGDLYTNGAFKAAFDGITTVTADDADVTILNYYDGSTPSTDGYSAQLLYNRVLTADEISATAAFTDSLSSPEISPNRRYFDRGSWVANGPQTSYGDSGPDLVTDGDMEAVGVAAWTVTNGTIEKSGANPHSGALALRLNDGAGADAYLAQVCLEVGKRYRARGWFRGDGTAAPEMHTGAAAIRLGTLSTSWQYFDATFVASYTSIFMMCRDGTSGNWVELDDLTVEQTNNLLSDGMMEDSGVGAWTAASAAALTKETISPYEGLQVLRITNSGPANPGAYQIMQTIGRTYRVTGRARGDGVAPPAVYDSGAVWQWQGTTSTDWQAFDVTYTAVGTSAQFYAITATVGAHVDFDDILVREVFEVVGSWDLGAIHSNTVADSSSHGNHGTVVGAVSPVPTDVGRAGSFDGNGRVVVPYDASLKLANNGSIACMVRPRVLSGGPNGVLCYGDVGSYANGYLLSQAGTGSGVYWFSAGPVFTAAGVFAVGQWTRLILNNDNGTLTLYANGESVGSGASGGAIVGNYVTDIGGWALANQSLNGEVANVEIKNRIWTEAEIKADYDRIARTCLYYEDMSRALPTVTPIVAGQQIPGTEYEVYDGTFSVVEGVIGGRVRKWIECVTDGLFWRWSRAAYGTWDFEWSKEAISNMRIG
ncbi:MAG: LamG-like jellyroll fold domain-containing protein, partial [Planctomycetota bacterium]